MRFFQLNYVLNKSRRQDLNLQPADYETAALPIELRGHGMDAGTFTLPLLPRYSCERITGIEPAFPAWEAGILPLYYIRITTGFIYRARRSRTLSPGSQTPALPVRTSAALFHQLRSKTVFRMPMRYDTSHRTVSLDALVNARIGLLL